MHLQQVSDGFLSTTKARPSDSVVTANAGAVPEWIRFERVLMRSTSELLVYAPDDAAAKSLRKALPDVSKTLQLLWWKRREWPPDPVPKVCLTTPSFQFRSVLWPISIVR